jgi:hypothetical protein
MNRAFSAVFHFGQQFSPALLWTDCGFGGTQGWNSEGVPLQHSYSQATRANLYSGKHSQSRFGAVSAKISTFPGCLLLLLVLYVFYLV